MPEGFAEAMVTVGENGHFFHDWTLAHVSERPNASRL